MIFRLTFPDPIGSSLECQLPIPVPRVGEYLVLNEGDYRVEEVGYRILKEPLNGEEMQVFEAIVTCVRTSVSGYT